MEMNVHSQAMRRRIAAWAGIAAALFVLDMPAVAQKASTPPRRPNVLFIAVDDLNTALSVYGNKVVKTPNIERLAKRGVVFQRSYCQFPLCNPSRVSLLAGRRPDTTRVLDLQTLPRTHLPNAVFLPEHFKNNGYYTARVGKIYHQSAAMKGTDNDPLSWNLSERSLPSRDLEKTVVRHKVVHGRGTSLRIIGGAPSGLRWSVYDAPDEMTGDGKGARRVAALLEERAKSGQPFFLAAGFLRPHLMWDAPKKYFDLYDPKTIPLPEEPAGHLAQVPFPAKNYAIRNSKIPPLSDADWREAIAAYYACVSFVDAQVGVLLDQMDKLKLWDSTVVVFFMIMVAKLRARAALREDETGE